MEITIQNVFIRYEDGYTAKGMGDGNFSVGILLKEFCTFTTGTDWKMKGL